MANTGATYPSLGASVSEAPWSDDAWSNPTYIYADDSTGASVTAATFDAGDQTEVLKATGFDFSAIPAGATIDGVVCAINAWSPTADKAVIDLMQLLNSTGGKTGDNKGSTELTLTTDVAAVYSTGNSTDLWGLSLTAAWVKSTSFGIAIGCMAGGSGNNNVDVHVDYVTLNIYYTAPSYGPMPIGSRGAGMSGGSCMQTSSIQRSEFCCNQNRYKNRED